MQMSIKTLIVVMSLLAATAEDATEDKDQNDMPTNGTETEGRKPTNKKDTLADKKMRIVLREHGLANLEISKPSKRLFEDYMSLYCISVTNWEQSTFVRSYLTWEEIEFLDRIKEFLDPTEKELSIMDSYFHHLGHDTPSNCSVKDDKAIRDSHDDISQETLFENYMYDQMTRNEWTPIPL